MVTWTAWRTNEHRRLRHRRVLHEVKEFTRLARLGIVEPRMSAGVLRSDPAALARLDGVVRRRILVDPVVPMKVWDASGRIVYSDEPRLIGSRYPFGADERNAPVAVSLARRRRDRFGLRLMRDLARDADGPLEVRTSPGRGARVTLEVPTG
jgi:hypothetical protein